MKSKTTLTIHLEEETRNYLKQLLKENGYKQNMFKRFYSNLLQELFNQWLETSQNRNSYFEKTVPQIENVKHVPINGYNGRYQIYENGQIWDKNLERWKPIYYNKFNKHYQVYLDNQGHSEGIHRLVYQYFVGPIPAGYVIHHIDFNPANQVPSNLTLMKLEDHISLHQLTNLKVKQKKPKKKHAPFTEEHKQHLREAKLGKKRKPFTDQHKQHMSESMKGKKKHKKT